MLKTKPDIRQLVETPLLGFGAVLLFLACFLLLLWVLTIIVRIIAG